MGFLNLRPLPACFTMTPHRRVHQETTWGSCPPPGLGKLLELCLILAPSTPQKAWGALRTPLPNSRSPSATASQSLNRDV